MEIQNGDTLIQNDKPHLSINSCLILLTFNCANKIL